MKELKSGSNLEKVLNAGHFAFTGECGPPKGANVEHLNEKLNHLVGVVDAVNMTDNQTAVVRMSSIAGSVLMMKKGLEPNFQMVCRDRNRLAMMSDVLGAYAMGIRNMLCLSGDHTSFGNHPEAKGVHDIDSMQLIAMVKKMRDEGKFLNGEDIDGPPKLFIGAASNPFGDPFEYRVFRLAKKIQAGVDFVQTQCIFNMEKFREFMKQAVDMGLHEKCYILAGVTPMKSAGMA
ncbi:MAG: 5,10-methylenetetrahydrofolate reductase, partial [Deltaproteobacteria bacterium RIFOXYC2_FULL_48_10]